MKIGFALCGSFCTMDPAFSMMEALAQLHDVTPIFSTAVYETDTRFGKAIDHIRQAEAICGNSVIHTIAQAEPIGPKKLLDALVIAPCTGNTLAKLAHSIADGPVTMAAKSHLRNGRPVVLALSTNDGLGGAAENIGRLLARKNYYFVPLPGRCRRKTQKPHCGFRASPRRIGCRTGRKTIAAYTIII